MKNIFFTNLLLLMMSVCLLAQHHGEIENMNYCGHTHGLKEFYKNNPEAKEQAQKSRAAFINRLKEEASKGESAFKTMVAPKRIPVVFHVLYGDCEDGNVTKDRIETAMEQLNSDFKGLNGPTDNDPTVLFSDRVGRMDVEFFLAEKDPNGNPTTGITRTQSPRTYEGLGDSHLLREVIMWPRNTYLNIYVVKKVNGSYSSGIANYPENSTGASINRDGIALADWAVGPRAGEYLENYNTIISHEVGHWLGLRHIWGDYVLSEQATNCDVDDFDHLSPVMAQYENDVETAQLNGLANIYNDTPNTIGNSTLWSDPNCLLSGATNSCNEGLSPGVADPVDMLANIMEYTGCANMFTKGQVNYMNKVLGDTEAQRNQVPMNAASVTLGTQSRAVFEETVLKEDIANDGTIDNLLNVELVNANFTNSVSINSFFTNGTHYNITWPTGFNPGNLTFFIRKTATDKATLQVTGTAPLHAEDIEFTIVFENAAFTSTINNINNRTKILSIDFIESATGVAYQQIQSVNRFVGPESRAYLPTYFKPNHLIGFLYNPTDGYKVYAYMPNLQIAVQPDDKVLTLNSSNTIPNDTPQFKDISNLLSRTGQTHDDYAILDVSSFTDGQEFYVAFRMGCSPSYSYGWIRLKKHNSPCDQIEILDMVYNSNIGGSIATNELGGVKAVYNSSLIQENPPGTFNDIEIELKGMPSGKGFKGAITAADFNIVGVPSLPNNFTSSNLSVTVNHVNKVTLSLNTLPSLPRDFQFKFTFNPSAFIAGTPTVDTERLIRVDFNDVIINPLNSQVSNTPLDYVSFYTGLSNEIYHPLGFQAITQGYLCFIPDYVFEGEVVCKTASSQEIKLFDCGASTNNLNFKPIGTGISNISDPLTNEVYIDKTDIQNWIGDYAYIIIKYKIGCNKALTAWVKLDVSNPNSLTAVEVAISEDNTSVIEPCYRGPCDAPIVSGALNAMYIQNVNVGNVNNSTTSSDGYEDYTNITLPLEATVPNPVNFIQGSDSPYTVKNDAHWYAFIDFNGDDYFEGSELVLIHQGRDVQQNLTIPSTTFSGTYKMRIMVSLYDVTIYTQDYACNIYSGLTYGEVEDYTVSVNGITPCSDADNDGVCDADDVCPNFNDNLIGTACDDNNACTTGDVYNSNCQCVGAFQDSDNDGVCDANDVCPNFDDNLIGTACDDGNPNTANDIIQSDCTCQGTLIGSPTYCTPNTASANNYIWSVILVNGGISNTSGNDGGYKDFTTEVAPGNISPSETYTLNLYKASDNGENMYWRVWIDYNQDGIFDNNTELVVNEGAISDNVLSRTFTVPTGIPNGTTRMRVYLKEYFGFPPIPCGNDPTVAADVEDYAITIGEDDCQVSYNLSGTINTNFFRAEDDIESNGQVPAGNTVTFQAGNLVHLKPGFIATAGTTSKFHALIDDCTPTAPKEEIVESEPAIRNYPNPFTGQTTIEFTLPEDSPVTLFVTDAMGRRVAVLMNHETSTAGTHQVIFDGNQYAAGMYYYTLQAGEYTSTQKMILIKP